MKFDVLNRFTGEVQFTAEIDCASDTPDSVKMGSAVRWAVKERANLRDADLGGADLGDADLGGADLGGADFGGANLRGAEWCDGITLESTPIQVYGLNWPVWILDDHMQIGCEIHSLDEWESFSDRKIAAMAHGALKFWRQWKESLLAMARAKGKAK